MLILRRIHVRYRLRVGDAADRETAARVHGFHAKFCPVYRSLAAAIDITTELELIAED